MEERWMALDVGSKRIGVAISDPLGLIAQGIEVYQRKGGLEKDLAYLAELFRKYQAQRLLLGLPRHMDGREGPEAQGIRKFGRLLGVRCGWNRCSGMNVDHNRSRAYAGQRRPVQSEKKKGH